MRDWRMLVWLTQLGLSIVLPLTGSILLGVWLHSCLNWGVWTIIAGLVLGLICAVQGFRDSLNAMERMAKPKKPQNPPPVSFNNHD